MTSMMRWSPPSPGPDRRARRRRGSSRCCGTRWRWAGASRSAVGGAEDADPPARSFPAARRSARAGRDRGSSARRRRGARRAVPHRGARALLQRPQHERDRGGDRLPARHGALAGARGAQAHAARARPQVRRAAGTGSGAAAIFSGDPTLRSAPASGGTMKSFAFKLLLPGLLLASAACLGVRASPMMMRACPRPPTPRGRPRHRAPTRRRSPLRRRRPPLLPRRHRGRRRYPRRRPAPRARRPGPRMTTSAARPNPSPRSTPAEDDPDADEHLVDAADCFERAGIVGKAIRVHTVLIERYPDTPNADASKEALARLLEDDARRGRRARHRARQGLHRARPRAGGTRHRRRTTSSQPSACTTAGHSSAPPCATASSPPSQPGDFDRAANAKKIAQFKGNDDQVRRPSPERGGLNEPAGGGAEDPRGRRR